MELEVPLLPVVHILSKTSPVDTVTFYPLIFSSCLHLGPPICLFSSGFRIKPLCGTWPNPYEPNNTSLNS
jgi:hypothetical protein